ncbi:MAG: biotin--[acetyl-CoA-carboxylase] ligase [Flavobacteriales bacterium]|nr:biotin--[acetyl-CoA-carboxylase] ligase [Flavobacteriales bacterium]
MDSSEFQFQFIHLNSVESTNIYAHKLIQEENVLEGFVITTGFQEKGKGQQTKMWESEPDKNLLMSVLLKPNWKVGCQFEWSKMVALSIKESLDSLAVGKVQVKWPNDILIEGEKVAGILIENSIIGETISNSIVGIGLNVNQTNFESFPRVATSLKLKGGREYELEEIRANILESLRKKYYEFDLGTVKKDYLNALYGYGVPKKFQDNEGDFTGVILGVLPNGRLQLNKNGKLKDYEVKEIVFLD